MNPFEVAKDYATGVWDTSRIGKYGGSKKGRPKEIGNGLTLLKHMERKNNESAINEME